MEPRGAVPFARGLAYTREQIRAAVGGNARAALPTRGGKVVCVCLTPEKNPRAPEEMVIGGNERALRLARAFAASGEAVPVFVRTKRSAWEYAGERRVRAVIEEPGALLTLVAEGAPFDVTLALRLEAAPKKPHDDGAAAPSPGALEPRAPGEAGPWQP